MRDGGREGWRERGMEGERDEGRKGVKVREKFCLSINAHVSG